MKNSASFDTKIASIPIFSRFGLFLMFNSYTMCDVPNAHATNSVDCFLIGVHVTGILLMNCSVISLALCKFL